MIIKIDLEDFEHYYRSEDSGYEILFFLDEFINEYILVKMEYTSAFWKYFEGCQYLSIYRTIYLEVQETHSVGSGGHLIYDNPRRLVGDELRSWIFNHPEKFI